MSIYYKDKKIAGLGENLNVIYPIGSIYTTIIDSATCPINFGTWEKIASGKCLFGANTTYCAGQDIEPGLPNISATTYIENNTVEFTGTTSSNGNHNHKISYESDDFDTPVGNMSLKQYSESLNNVSTSTDGEHTHTFSGTATFSPIATTTLTKSSIYKDNFDSVQPPAIAVIFWRRIA